MNGIGWYGMSLPGWLVIIIISGSHHGQDEKSFSPNPKTCAKGVGGGG